jgi:hypothetical protein
MFFPNYKLQAKLNGASINSKFDIDFKAKMLKSSVNDKNIELIDVASGERVPVSFNTASATVATVMPKAQLKKGGEYYLVVSPKTIKSDNKALGYGIIEEITIAK